MRWLNPDGSYSTTDDICRPAVNIWSDEYAAEQARCEFEERQAIDEHEESGDYWRSVFNRMRVECPDVSYGDKPGYDRRCFDVSGMRSVS